MSDTGISFAQNTNGLRDYYTHVNNDKLAIRKGYILNSLDISFRKYILDISCRGETMFREEDLPILETAVFPRLSEMQKNGIVEWDNTFVKLTEQGHYFIRKVCSAFDLYLNKGGRQWA
jgi:oxygen-independent coproporphyrinogen-3 oxidase